jgi:hypothetical protein
MGLVRNREAPAWELFGAITRPDPGGSLIRIPVHRLGVRWRTPMLDLAYIGLTVLVFGVLYLIVKGIERFER